MRWYRKAADQGMAQAQNNVGNLYKDGRGVARDLEEALAVVPQERQTGGYDAAQLHSRHTMYINGEGTAQDYTEALRWYRKAADQGVPAAQYDVGLIYDNGLGVPRDPGPGAMDGEGGGRRPYPGSTMAGDEPNEIAPEKKLWNSDPNQLGLRGRALSIIKGERVLSLRAVGDLVAVIHAATAACRALLHRLVARRLLAAAKTPKDIRAGAPTPPGRIGS